MGITLVHNQNNSPICPLRPFYQLLKQRPVCPKPSASLGVMVEQATSITEDIKDYPFVIRARSWNSHLLAMKHAGIYQL